ncbi:MAG: DNA topoisomerase I [Candidatus Bathyarchaeota archaeon]|nr:DNA topoisomerase I [Candidatus Bathyarchaeota archaeon]
MQKYTLIVTEKPDAASQIASAIDIQGHPRRMQQNGVPYYEAQRDKKVVVVPALGHLYTVTSQKKRSRYPVFDLKWAPRYEVERKAQRVRGWLQAISVLAQNADEFVDACDYDIEGSIIGYCILKYTCNGKDQSAKRMKYSTLTKEELQSAYENLLPHLDFALIEAGLARHEIDWLYGINLSRALTTAAKNYSNHYATLSTGRVQGPTLKFLATREKAISCFVPTPYWSIHAKLQIGEETTVAEHATKVFEVKKYAKAVADKCRGKSGEVEAVESSRVLQMPPVPFDLGALQSEAYKFFRYTPMRTLSIAQRLYLDALISYPRTSSQKLPPSIGYKKILQKLSAVREYTNLAGTLLSKPTLKPTQGKKQDPAHPAIYPTGKLPKKPLTAMEKNIWNLVVHRFFAVFGEPAVRLSVKATFDVAGERFVAEGKQTVEEGWLVFYQPFMRLQDTMLPPMSKGENVGVKRISVKNEFTKPPARYNPGSILRKMEQGNIGTKATRAGIIQTLYDRNYIASDKIAVTDLGFEVTEVLGKYCPSVVSLEFTRTLEERMERIQRGEESKGGVVADAVEALKPVTAALKENEKAIGEQLSQAVVQAKLEEKVIGKCPTCADGKLVILHSKKTKKRFAGCTNYFQGTCTTSFALPQKGTVKPSGKTCKNCGWSTVHVWLRGKRPWNLCINPDCNPKKTTNSKGTIHHK